MHDVIVCDEEFESASAEIRKACRKIDWIVSLYLQIMEKACKTGVMAGETAEALNANVAYAAQLRDAASLIAERHFMVKQYFLDAVDSADDYLY